MNNLPPMANPKITVDIVTFTIENGLLKILLVKRQQEPELGRYALPGGFLWQDETTKEAARRILKDKANVDNVFFEQLYTFDDPQRDSRGHVITVAYLVLVPSEKLYKYKLNSEVEFREINKTDNLPFDHNKILSYGLRRLRTKLVYSNVAYSLLAELFTLSQLQEIYEVILGHAVDKRNFRKKILSLNLIEPTDKKLTGNRNRPAQLFRFKTHSYTELEEPIF